jgi:Zn ribbon nucleic-acid-binding protein
MLLTPLSLLFFLFRAIDVIKKGTPVKATFGCLYLNAPASDRNEFLSNKFGYDCDCPACVNDWPCLAQFPDRVVVCPSCQARTRLVTLVKDDGVACRACGHSFVVAFQAIGKTRRRAERMMSVMSTRLKLNLETIRKLTCVITELIGMVDPLFQHPDKDSLISRGFLAKSVILETITRQL